MFYKISKFSEQHHNSNGSEDLDGHKEDQFNQDSEDFNMEDFKEELEAANAHGEVQRASNEKHGYGQVENTIRDFDDSINDITETNMDANSKQSAAAQNYLSNMANIDLTKLSEEQKQVLANQINQIQPENVIDVVQSCLDGQFKPFLGKLLCI